jgi:predicted metal-dependent hydrolase
VSEPVYIPNYLDIDGFQVPLRVSFSHRRGIRFSFSHTGLNYLCPLGLPRETFLQYLEELRVWARQQFEAKPKLRERYVPPQYHSGQEIETCFRTFRLEIIEHHFESVGKRKDQNIRIFLEPGLSPFQRQKHFNHQLSKLIAFDLMPQLERRVDELNDWHFRVPLQGIGLRNNHSRWGSCSSQGKLNFAARLMLAPMEVVDYVIVHELAHRIEMNHSQNFWNLVARAMPDFERHERYLKEDGWRLRF